MGCCSSHLQECLRGELERAVDKLGLREPSSRPASVTMRGALLVHPRDFSVTPEAVDNHYKNVRPVDPARALQQHHQLLDTLGDCGVPVTVFPGYGGLVDAVFPNNAFATRPGRLIIGSMCHPVRRGETAREDIRAYFRDVMGRELVDLSARPVIAELALSPSTYGSAPSGYLSLRSAPSK